MIFAIYLAFLIPVYWRAYGVTAFLSFCDVALFLTFLGIIWVDKVLISMAAIGILLPQAVWIMDFFGAVTGYPLLGLTTYMLDPKYSVLLRGLSLFHLWLPGVLWHQLYFNGYDSRAFLYWTILAWGLLYLSYRCTKPPGRRHDNDMTAVNVNFVYGPFLLYPQTLMPAWCWLGLVMVGLPVVVYYPTHCLCCHLFLLP